MNARLLCLLVGLILGAIVGYVTRPEAAEVKIGSLSIEVQGNRPASADDGGSLTTGQMRHMGLYTIAGGVLGVVAGLVAGRGRA